MPYRRLATIIGAFALLVLLVYADAALTLETYYGLEKTWGEHWPIKSQRGALEALEPTMLKLRILRPARVEVEHGISFFLDPADLVPVSILRSGQWQPEVWSSIAPALSEGSVFLDVGAHIGYFSIKAARKVGATGRVLSFDPNPEILKLLRDNVAANRTSNVIVEPIACTDRDQMLTFYAVPTNNTGASSLARDNAEPWSAATKSYQVRGRPIDDVVRELNLSRVDAIKVDVEGAEVSVLRGTLNTLKRFHPKLIVEVSAPQLASFHTTPADLVSLIRSAGYDYSRPLNPEQSDWEWMVADAHNLVSTVSVEDPSASSQFIRGVSPGAGGAHWTEPKFTVALLRPPGSDKNGARLTLKFFVAEPSIKALKAITLAARVGGTDLQPETYTADGVYEYRREVPASAFGKSVVEVDFSVDPFLTMNGNKMGILVMTAGLQSK
jgi:FkbM family methyltransferase